MSAGEVVLRLAASVVVGYLLGSIPSGVWLGKLAGNKDPRAAGSGKTGATNVLRTMGPGAAAIVVVLDLGKGVVAVLAARYIFFNTAAGREVFGSYLTSWRAIGEGCAAFAALFGHNHSIFIHFTGGRGVLTGSGGILAMQPIAWLAGLLVAIVSIALTRYVSLGSMLAAATCAITDFFLMLAGHDSLPHLIYMVVGGVYVVYSHSDNIHRLLTGTERKLGQPATKVV